MEGHLTFGGWVVENIKGGGRQRLLISQPPDKIILFIPSHIFFFFNFPTSVTKLIPSINENFIAL